MAGVQLPQMLLYLTGDTGKTRFSSLKKLRKLKWLKYLKYPEKRNVDLKSLQVFLSFTTLVFLMGSYSSALIPDTEEFASIASAAEKLNEQIAGADERLQSELQTLGSKINFSELPL
ncbi:unnamed protein product [Pleuronectes platessa]|uniref:Uncharacterized protein n=1 Tax=Pleuronectes platessa TaxID=8262 RepID=A0A9N7TZ28_PLEPL|nr:unnamed protein product [Pleuronectes platessa]